MVGSKEQERAELHRTIWGIANDLRGSVAHSAALVHHDDIAANDYNLSVSTYVEQEDTREKVDIKKLNAELAAIVERESELRKAIDKIIKEIGE